MITLKTNKFNTFKKEKTLNEQLLHLLSWMGGYPLILLSCPLNIPLQRIIYKSRLCIIFGTKFQILCLPCIAYNRLFRYVALGC